MSVGPAQQRTLPDPQLGLAAELCGDEKELMGGQKSRVFPGFSPVGSFNESYLVDPASSHMLVSKIKPCMSKYKQLCTVKLRMAH